MRSLTSAFLFLLSGVAAGGVAACGGQVEDPAPGSTTGSNSPSSTPPTTGCAGACDRFRECTAAFDHGDVCLRDCAREFPDPARASTYATCIQAISCEWIERGLSMSYGPIGECYSKASKLNP